MCHCFYAYITKRACVHVCESLIDTVFPSQHFKRMNIFASQYLTSETQSAFSTHVQHPRFSNIYTPIFKICEISLSFSPIRLCILSPSLPPSLPPMPSLPYFLFFPQIYADENPQTEPHHWLPGWHHWGAHVNHPRTNPERWVQPGRDIETPGPLPQTLAAPEKDLPSGGSFFRL